MTVCINHPSGPGLNIISLDSVDLTLLHLPRVMPKVTKLTLRDFAPSRVKTEFPHVQSVRFIETSLEDSLDLPTSVPTSVETLYFRGVFLGDMPQSQSVFTNLTNLALLDMNTRLPFDSNFDMPNLQDLILVKVRNEEQENESEYEDEDGEGLKVFPNLRRLWIDRMPKTFFYDYRTCPNLVALR